VTPNGMGPAAECPAWLATSRLGVIEKLTAQVARESKKR
jgi:hypothetical protein